MTSISQELNSQWKKAFTIREIATACLPADGERKSWVTAYRLCIGSSGRKSITIVSGPIERARAKWSNSTVAWRCMSISPDSSYARCRSSGPSTRETPRQPPPSNGFM